ncbi:MAG: hypothetical protein ABI542_11085, partial [Gemmatimonadota bacterium]
IMHAERLGLAARDRAIVALVSRYHRKAGPSRRHEELGQLDPEDQAIVRRVSAVLRVADGLDRGHTSSVDHMTVTLLDDRCVIRAYPRIKAADLSLEIWGAERKADVLAKALGMDVVIAAGL